MGMTIGELLEFLKGIFEVIVEFVTSYFADAESDTTTEA